MIRRMSNFSTETPLNVIVHSGAALSARLPQLADFVRDSSSNLPLSKHPAWLTILQRALGHEVYALEVRDGDTTHGFLPLAFVSSFLFGRFLVSLPYLNTNGVIARSPDVQTRLIDRAITLADELGVRYLELRHERPIEHPDLNAHFTSKVHMRLDLPRTSQLLWKQLDPKVRNQVRKGTKSEFQVAWGGQELLDGFYHVLCRNMRDLGTPVYGQGLFRETLRTFPDDAEICLLCDGQEPVAAAMLLHGAGITEVPTASSLKEYNPSCVNMLMYSHLMDRAIERGQAVFDFGRSTLDGPTFRFKKQWGALPQPATWQYHVRHGSIGEMRPDSPHYSRAVRLWQRLPLSVTRWLGPRIVRGIP
jgi:FemAB-related protein (PEP-CTERM system-associated)